MNDINETPVAANGIDERRFRRLDDGFDCSCCGAVATSGLGRQWTVHRAGLVDSDGEYYPRLCQGCLPDVLAEQGRGGDRALLTQEAAAALEDLMPDEYADGIVSLLEDFGLLDP